MSLIEELSAGPVRIVVFGGVACLLIFDAFSECRRRFQIPPVQRGWSHGRAETGPSVIHVTQ